ncbi:accessory Sec system protein Asp3 [Fructilactobacillus frigidiflavus]|uniref:accessory Sec system protein Asp3 n=1 Tax=Fructilactobacillus frigidiflavus TaxID=3242688 RepID=UPI0037580865
METIYLLHWDPADTNTDTYGSQISYQKDGSVQYQNELQPAGKKMHWWQTNYFGDPDPLQSARYGSKRLPQIPRNQTFSLVFKGTVIPEHSVGLTVRSFDETGQLIDQKMTLNDQLNFELNDEEQAYEVSLVKFNNTEILFQGLLLIPDTVTKQYQIQPQHGQMMVRQFHRVVDALPLPTETLTEPLRIVLINDRWNQQQLQQVEHDFKTKFKLEQVDCSASDLKAQALLNRK